MMDYERDKLFIQVLIVLAIVTAIGRCVYDWRKACNSSQIPSVRKVVDIDRDCAYREGMSHSHCG